MRTRAVIETCYGNIATAAVSAVKLGAVDYFVKAVDPDDVAAALLAPERAKPEPLGASNLGRSCTLAAHQKHRDGTATCRAPAHSTARSRETKNRDEL